MSAIHSEIIAAVLRDQPGAQTRGFIRALKQLPDAEYMAWLLEKDPKWWTGINFVPDAWLIDADKRHVVIWEAVHRHDVSANKIAKMVDLAWALDEDHYKLFLIRCERFHRRGFAIRDASIVSDLELRAAGEPDSGWHIPDWHKFDAAYCSERLAQFMEASSNV